MKGDLHHKPCAYNCPCNIGVRKWLECDNCLQRRRPQGEEAGMKDFVVVWRDIYKQQRVDVVTIAYPPHEPPRGSVLDELLLDGANKLNPLAERLIFAVELGDRHHSPGAYREVAVGDGRVASLECSSEGWRVHL